MSVWKCSARGRERVRRRGWRGAMRGRSWAVLPACLLSFKLLLPLLFVLGCTGSGESAPEQREVRLANRAAARGCGHDLVGSGAGRNGDNEDIFGEMEIEDKVVHE